MRHTLTGPTRRQYPGSMADEFLRMRPVTGHDRITPERARQLYDAAQADPDSGLTGTLQDGFEFYTTYQGVRLVPMRVEPVGDGDGPAG